MRVLLIGGNGFIGSHVQDVLLGRGHSVRVLDVSPERYRTPLPGVEWVVGSSADSSALAPALADVDSVVYLASTTVPSTSNADVSRDIESNLVPLAATLDAMLGAGVARIVYFSSGGTVYGIADGRPVAEDAPLDPVCSYGIVKLAGEKYLGMYRQLHGLRPLILRPSNPFGPRQGHEGIQGFIATCLGRMSRDQHIELWGDGNVVRDYLYVGDLALAVALGVESDVTGVLNVGSGEGKSLLAVLSTLAEVTGVMPRVERRQGRPFDVPHLVLSTSLARRVLGWNPETTFEDGIVAHWHWLVEARDAGGVGDSDVVVQQGRSE
jgi:UDP-glucose 4-epimerase